MNRKTIETADFYLASFLLAKDVHLLEIKDSINSNRKIFIFEHTNEAERLVNAFWARQELIEPIILLNAQRWLKTRLFSQSDTGSNKGGQKDE